MPEVLPYIQALDIQHQLVRQLLRNQYSDGYVTYRSAETVFSRASGTKTIDSYKGVNVFTLTYSKLLSGAGNKANTLWLFFLARLDALNEPFYIYNPPEHYPPDLTGEEVIGRYLVNMQDPNQALAREYFARCLFNQGIILQEVPVYP